MPKNNALTRAERGPCADPPQSLRENNRRAVRSPRCSRLGYLPYLAINHNVAIMITAEGEKLGRHWTQYGQDYLDSYLIQNVEHPSINPQSILIRAFVIDLLFPGKFTEIIEEELFFSACACHALQAYGKGRLRDVFEAVRGNHVNAAIPPFLHKGFRTGRSHIFDCEQLIAELAKCITLGFEYFRSPFSEESTARAVARTLLGGTEVDRVGLGICQ